MISRVDVQLANLYKTILNEGTWKYPAREGQIKTLSKFDYNIELNAGKEALISTIKKVSFKNVLTELLWFLKGDTNIKYLIDNGCNIWNQDAYRYYKDLYPLDTCTSFEHFIDHVKNGSKQYYQGADKTKRLYTFGDLGNIYGYQWIKSGAMARVIKELIINRNSRYLVIDSWDESKFFKDGIRSKEVALPCCHYSMQFYARIDSSTGGKVLDLKVLQRSADTFLGVPYNLLSYQILLMIIAKFTNMNVGKLYWSGGDCHIYENQLDAVNDYIETFNDECKTPTYSIEPKVILNDSFNAKARLTKKVIAESPYLEESLKLINDFLYDLDHNDFNLLDYTPIKTIKAPLSTGLK